MNSRILQRHLENRLVILVKACANDMAQDDGLIYEIITNLQLDDESRLNYISQIEYRLPQVQVMVCANEWSLNSRYSDEEREAEEDERWAKAQQMLLDEPQLSTHQIPKETCTQLADMLALH